MNNRRLSAIRIKLQELTREKVFHQIKNKISIKKIFFFFLFQTKYNVEKLTQDVDFLQSEIGHLSHAIADINKEINAQTYNKKALVIRFI